MTNLVWLLLSLALATAPHLERLPLWVGPICLAMGLWRLGIMRSNGALPRKWLLILIAFAATAGIFSHYHTLLGRDAGVALLVTMIALKLMEMKTLRDTMVVIFLSYFLVITHFFYSQSIPTALYLLLVVLLTTATMIGYSHPLDRIHSRPRLRLAGTMLLQAIPLMLVLFVFFPRVGPLWGLPKDAYSGMTGLSDSMSPGAISQLIRSDAVAFRVKFDGPPPDNSQRYWRGPVLWDYDGKTWSTRNKPPAGTAQFTPLGQPFNYTITLEPHNQRWLFALDLPAVLPPGSNASADFQILAPSPLHQRIRYSLTSYPAYRLGENLSDDAWERALNLPGGNPKAMQLATQWRASLESPRAIAQQALKMFREEDFFYTLNPPLLGEQAVDDFHLRHPARILRTLRQLFCVSATRGRRSGPGGDRLPGRRTQSHGRLHDRAPVRCPRMGRNMARWRRMGTDRPYRSGVAEPHRNRHCQRPARCRTAPCPDATGCGMADAHAAFPGPA